MGYQVHLGHEDLQDLKVMMDEMEHQVCLVCQARRVKEEGHVRFVHLEQKEKKVKFK